MVVIPTRGTSSYINYEAAQNKEITGLLERKVFEIVSTADVPKNVRIFGTRFMNEVKNVGTIDAYEKSRLVVQAYNDHEKGLVLRTSPTIQRSSQRLLIGIAAYTATTLGAKLYLRDVTQAYVQSGTNLNRDFYIRPPPKIKDRFPTGCILKIVKPLYDIPEAENHWFKAYHKHHLEKLHMKLSTHNPYLLRCQDPGKGFRAVSIQTNDILILADNEFANQKEGEIYNTKIDYKSC